MAHIITVNLAKKTNKSVLTLGGVADVNLFDLDEDPHLIVWRLGLTLADGNFVSMGNSAKGFAWTPKKPPRGVFSKATIGLKGRVLWMTNYHADSKSTGSWGYVLRVSLNGAVYETVKSPSLTATGPIIINHEN